MIKRSYLLWMVLAAAPAVANDTVNVDFDVSADAAACSPSLSNNGVADFNTRNAGSLSRNAFTQLGTRELTLSISCESSTALAITSRDTRSSSVTIGEDSDHGVGPYFNVNGGMNVAYASRLFGLGTTAENKSIGSYAIRINPTGIVAMDGNQNVSVDVAGSESKLGGWSRAEHYLLPATEDFFYTFVRKGTLTPQTVSSVSVPLEISVSVADNLGSSQIISLDGEAVISLVYL